MSGYGNNKVFTSGEAARVCGVSADTVSRWFDVGQLEGYRLGPGGDRRIPFENLRKFMISHGIPLDRLEANELRILVVDDDPYYLDILPAALAKEGKYSVAVASTGFDAGAQVVAFEPHLIILDIHLSDADGRMVCERVKNRPETRGTRVLAISGFLDDADARELRNYGFDGYLRKPFSINDLLERVEGLLKATPKKSGGAKPSGTVRA